MNYKSRHKSVSAWLTIEEYERLGRLAESLKTTRGKLVSDAVHALLNIDVPTVPALEKETA